VTTTLSDIVRDMHLGRLSEADATAQLAELGFGGGAIPAQAVADGEKDALVELKAEPITHNPFLSPGEISPQEYARLSPAQARDLEAAKPGTMQRMEKAEQWTELANVEAERELAARKQAQHEHRLATNPEYAKAQHREQAARSLRDNWWFLSDTRKQELIAQAELTESDLAQISQYVAERSVESRRVFAGNAA
jgi:hypothetical protein